MSECRKNARGPDLDPMPAATEDASPLPWEQIEAGRFMPRRIRGSLLGRELG
jgi:hypothetical protein